MTSMQPGDPRVAADVLAEEAAAAQAPAEESSDDAEGGEEPASEDMTVAQLRDLAGSRGVDLSGASTKADILERLSGGGSGSVSGSGSGSVPQPEAQQGQGAEAGPEAGPEAGGS
jgi:hypothetical protein